jgi:hypothetical protein
MLQPPLVARHQLGCRSMDKSIHYCILSPLKWIQRSLSDWFALSVLSLTSSFVPSIDVFNLIFPSFVSKPQYFSTSARSPLSILILSGNDQGGLRFYTHTIRFWTPDLIFFSIRRPTICSNDWMSFMH